jgi:hypothetical protein
LQVIIENSFYFTQLFFYNSIETIKKRHEQHSNLNSHLLRFLTNMLDDCNSFISLYKIANEVLQSNMIFNDLRVILNSQMRLIVKKDFNKRRTNLFTNDEIIAIISNEYNLSDDRDILLTKCRNKFESFFMCRIS